METAQDAAEVLGMEGYLVGVEEDLEEERILVEGEEPFVQVVETEHPQAEEVVKITEDILEGEEDHTVGGQTHHEEADLVDGVEGPFQLLPVPDTDIDG